MNAFSDELRLFWILLLNGGLFACAYRFARRRGQGGAIQAVCDASLLYFLTQYLAIALPALFGAFTATSMSLVAVVAAAAMWKGGMPASIPPIEPSAKKVTPTRRGSMKRKRKKRPSRIGNDRPETLPWMPDHYGLAAVSLFCFGYIGSYAWSQRPIPPIATDAIVYHLPMAVHWIQTHRLGIYPTWYWNPAASYSPGTGSIFMAWWIAPAGNDIFVRYVQLLPLLFIFFLVVRLCRLMGCSRTLGGLIAVSATLSRPLFSEAVIPKDDLYVTAFVVAGVLSLARGPMRDRLGSWRVGVALGMVLASKYTVLLACPIFLFLVDAPFRAGWKVRQWLIAVSLIALLALPWYVRNIVLTGNPLYPVDVHLPGLTLKGLFSTERDQQLRTAGGIWDMLAGRYHSLPGAMIVLLFVSWLLACGIGRRALLQERLPRACVIGSAATLLLFLTTSPHHEVRYMFPLIVLLFAATGFALGRIAQAINHALSIPTSSFTVGEGKEAQEYVVAMTLGGAVACMIALGIAIFSTITSFSMELFPSTAGFAVRAMLIAAVGMGLLLLQTRWLQLKKDRLAILAGCAALLLAMVFYVGWRPYVNEYRQSRMIPWASGYPLPAELWKWVDENVPADGTIAYANTFFVYPYYGFNLSRHLGYAPIRKGLHDFRDFPRLGQRVPGDLIVRRMTEVMNENPDRQTWLENLRAMNAGYLVVMKHDPDNPDLSDDPPELRFARMDSKVFVPLTETDAGVVFRIEGAAK